MSLRAVVSRRFWRSSLRAGPRPSRAVSSAAWSALDAIETLDKLRVLTFMNALAGQLDPKTIEAADFDDADDAYDVAFPLNAVGCHGLVKHILSGGRLNAKSLSKIMREACKALLADPMVQELHISRGGRCVVVGDLHGSIADLGAALAVVGTPAAGTNCVVFNGDFVDRGDDGCEVLAVVLAMRLSFPGAVHLNRGNHEDAALSRVYDFANELAIKYGPAQADALLGDADAAFAAMPLAAVVDGHTLVIHGGVPRAKPTLHDLAAAPRLRSVATAPLGTAAERLVRDALWSDPDTRGHVSGDGVDNLARGGAGCVMSDDAVSDWLETQGLKRLVRSHEAAATGAEKTEMRHGKERWTIFSCSHYPNGEGLNKAAVLVLHGDGACVSWKPFPPSSTATVRASRGSLFRNATLGTTSTRRWEIQEAFSNDIERFARRLRASLRRHGAAIRAELVPGGDLLDLPDVADRVARAVGAPSALDWLQVLLPPLLPRSGSSLSDPECRRSAQDWAEALLGAAARPAQAGQIRGSARLGASSVDALFDSIDSDGDGSLSYDEFYGAILRANAALPEQSRPIDADATLRLLDADASGSIDRAEFHRAFSLAFGAPSS